MPIYVNLLAEGKGGVQTVQVAVCTLVTDSASSSACAHTSSITGDSYTSVHGKKPRRIRL